MQRPETRSVPQRHSPSCHVGGGLIGMSRVSQCQECLQVDLGRFVPASSWTIQMERGGSATSGDRLPTNWIEPNVEMECT